MVFNGVHRQLLEVLEVWNRNISESRDAKTQGAVRVSPNMRTTTLASKRQNEQLQKPGFGTIKINTDAV